MNSRVCLDTSAYSAFKRGQPDMVAAVQRADEIVVSVVTLGELRAGFLAGRRRRENEDELGRFLRASRVSTVAVDEETARRYSDIVLHLRRQGTPVPTNDVWIAASAMQHGLRVLTTDPHFGRMPQVTVDILAP